MKLNLGCGLQIADGWVNADKHSERDDVVQADVLEGLPFEAETFEEVYIGHVLHLFDYAQIRQALLEVRRVLHPDGELRIAEFDPTAAFYAWTDSDWTFFPFDTALEPTLEGQLCRMLTWNSTRKTLWTALSLWPILESCGFGRIWSSVYGRHPLDQRERESFFLVAA